MGAFLNQCVLTPLKPAEEVWPSPGASPASGRSWGPGLAGSQAAFCWPSSSFHLNFYHKPRSQGHALEAPSLDTCHTATSWLLPEHALGPGCPHGLRAQPLLVSTPKSSSQRGRPCPHTHSPPPPPGYFISSPSFYTSNSDTLSNTQRTLTVLHIYLVRHPPAAPDVSTPRAAITHCALQPGLGQGLAYRRCSINIS